MLNKIQKRKEGGFTIIEVLIVLAIAGLIMLIVFLAVPALQRNSRNTQRKSDVASVLSAVTEWSNNNSGKLPSASGSERAEAIANAKLGFYTTTDVSWAAGDVTNNRTTEQVQIVTGAKCASNGNDTDTGSGRQFVALYKVETGGGTDDFICQEG